MNEIESKLIESIKRFDKSEVENITLSNLDEGTDPLTILSWFNAALKEIGEDYSEGKIFLPELVGATSVVENVMPPIMKKILEEGKKVKSKGIVAIGTVFGDIHSIGKTMVSTLLRANGFEVIDLGINVRAEVFIDAIKKREINILALSALLTTTALEQEKVIKQLEQENLRNSIKIMVGGGAITKEFAEEIGADGYSPSAPGAVKLAENLMIGKYERR